MIIVSDTSPISNLLQINSLAILQDLFSEIIVPPFVHQEILALESFGVDLSFYKNAGWIKILIPNNLKTIQALEEKLDRGEAEAIALAEEINAELLILDERKGTQEAKARGLNTVGLLGVLVKAKEEDIIPELRPILENLMSNGFWISDNLKAVVLASVGEDDSAS